MRDYGSVSFGRRFAGGSVAVVLLTALFTTGVGEASVSTLSESISYAYRPAEVRLFEGESFTGSDAEDNVLSFTLLPDGVVSFSAYNGAVSASQVGGDVWEVVDGRLVMTVLGVPSRDGSVSETVVYRALTVGFASELSLAGVDETGKPHLLSVSLLP